MKAMASKLSSLKHLAYICLYTSNLIDSVKFYRDVLGLEPANPDENVYTTNFYAFKTGTTMLAIERNGVKKNGMKTKAENPILLQFDAESKEHLEEMTKVLEEKGIKVYDRLKQTHYGWITNFCDPDGNKLEILYQS